MKKIRITVFIFFYFANTGLANAPDSVPALLTDVKSPDAIIAALYSVVSGGKDVKRNWDRMRTLFHQNAAMIPIGKKKDSSNFARYISVEDYINLIGPNLEKSGFFEKEIKRKSEIFGSMAQVWSTYESRRKKEDPKPFLRGINSIQIWNDGTRWWIMNIMWLGETETTPIPKQYTTNQ